jgi:hypothetical protein
VDINMSHTQIIKYYLLSSIRLGERRHLVNELPDKKLELIFTKKEILLYLRKQDGVWVPRENVIGGSSNDDKRVIVIG